MAEFCKCGSLMMNGRCTNKACAIEAQGKGGLAGPSQKKSRSAAAKGTSAVKPVNPRRASKCITYNLYDVKPEEEKDNAD